jgi:hypothetical protein
MLFVKFIAGLVAALALCGWVRRYRWAKGLWE